MKPWEILDHALTPAGASLELWWRDDLFVIKVDGRDLMLSDQHGSEERLAELACERLRRAERPQVLVGGLGMGFTLRAALDTLPGDAAVVVAELSDAVAAWNRTFLGCLAGQPLDDPRVTLVVGDVVRVIEDNPARFDTILLDVDNGPRSLSPANERLYTPKGILDAHGALAPGGMLAVWSAWDSPAFANRLRRGGFRVEVVQVRALGKKGGRRHVLFMARRTP